MRIEWSVLLCHASGLAMAVISMRILVASREPATESGRTRRWWLATIGLMSWTALSVATKLNWFYRTTGVEPRSGSRFSDLLILVGLLALLLVLPPRAWPLAAATLAGALGLLTWAQVLHFRFFQDLFRLDTLLALEQASILNESLPRLAPAIEWLRHGDVLWASLAATLLTLASRRGMALRISGTTRLAALATAIVLLAGAMWFAALGEDNYFTRRDLVADHGLLATHVSELSSPLERPWTAGRRARDLARAETWFRETAALRSAQPGRPTARWNVILLQVEALQGFVLDQKVGEPPEWVMPNIRRRLGDAFRFETALDQTHLGRTSDAEMIALASLLPATPTAAAISQGDNAFVALPKILGEIGYSTLSAVPFAAEFWNRTTTHSAYGFDESYFEQDFEDEGIPVGWGLNDQGFLRQSRDLIEQQDEPFFSFLITLSLHWPFENFPDEFRTLPSTTRAGQEIDPKPPSPLDNFFEAMRFFDTAFEEFMVWLETSGSAERTIVVLFGDHDLGLWDDPELPSYVSLRQGLAPSLIQNDTIPLIFWVPGTESERPWGGWVGSETAPVGLVDLAPTLLGLLGRDASSLPWQGRNLHLLTRAPPAVAADWRTAAIPQALMGNWLSEHLIYVSQGPGPYRGRCYRRHPRLRKTARREPCVTRAGAIERQLAVGRGVLRSDLQEELLAALAPAP